MVHDRGMEEIGHMSYSAFNSLFPGFEEFSLRRQHAELIFDRRPKGSYLCHAGDPLPRLLFLMSGRARVFMPLFGGKDFLLRIYQPGDIVGDLEFFLGEGATCSVQCTTEVVICSYPVDVVRGSVESYSKAIMKMGTSIATKLKENSVAGAVNSAYPVAARLATYFLTHRDTDLRERSLQELADWLGTSYRHLTRTLKNLVTSGALCKNGRWYDIQDEGLLSALASDALNEEHGRL